MKHIDNTLHSGLLLSFRKTNYNSDNTYFAYNLFFPGEPLKCVCGTRIEWEFHHSLGGNYNAYAKCNQCGKMYTGIIPQAVRECSIQENTHDE